MKPEDYLPLAAKLAHRTYSEEELASVITFLKEADRRDAEAFLDEYARIVSSLSPEYTAVPELTFEIEQIQRRAEAQRMEAVRPSGGGPGRVVQLRQWVRYAAAIVVVGGLSYALTKNFWGGATLTPQHASEEQVLVPVEIPPAANRATLTLSNGEVIVLDSAADGQLAVQHGTRIVKDADRIIYRGDESERAAASFNTMSTPRGGQYTLTLADGTRIWLNAASSITYPARFDGRERMVRVTGEVYFEVARRADQPFVVEAGGDRITVLGTAFNVRAYSGEGPVKTSLIEGSVRINNALLKPGQAYIAGEVVATTLEHDVAWRNGYFNFHGMDLQSVMREIGRWYDVQVVYPEGVPAIEFGGELQRNLDLAQILKALEKSNVRYRMEINASGGERTLVVLN